MYAVAAPTTTCLELLLSAGLAVTLRDEHFRTVYHYAVRNRNAAALSILLGFWPVPTHAIFTAAVKDHARRQSEARRRAQAPLTKKVFPHASSIMHFPLNNCCLPGHIACPSSFCFSHFCSRAPCFRSVV